MLLQAGLSRLLKGERWSTAGGQEAYPPAATSTFESSGGGFTGSSASSPAQMIQAEGGVQVMSG